MGFTSFFKLLGSLILKAFNLASASGLKDVTVQLALKYAREAEAKFTSNVQKREWVIDRLKARGIPESLARLALELGIQLLHKELNPS